MSSAGVKNSKQANAQQAQWNVQVVRGKVTTRCLWNACKALSIGLLLLAIGTTMAVVGYYADQLSIRSETRGNSTVKIKNESRGFHLNNLSYAGPIIMGIGGFIVVAACVMTFEARDSAAKVVPARFKPNLDSTVQGGSTERTPRGSRTFRKAESKRSASVQAGGGAGRWAGARRSGARRPGSPTSAGGRSPKNDPIGRKAFAAAFVQLSRELLENSAPEVSRRRREAALDKSPSAPDLGAEGSAPGPLDPEPSGYAGRKSKAPARAGGKSQREHVRPPEGVSGNLLLRPNRLRRQAASVDNPFYDNYECFTPPSKRLSRQCSRRSGGSRESLEMEPGSGAGVGGSLASMALDLHDCQVTLKVTDASADKRSDTARRHQLLRQKPVEDDREEKYPRCSCVPRFLRTPAVEDCSGRTKSSTNLKSPCHHCARVTGRGRVPKMMADFRSQSFSITSASAEPKKCALYENRPRIFCIEDHKKKANLSSENIRVCCECFNRNSPCVSPHAGFRNKAVGCRAEGFECLVHRSGHPLLRTNAEGRKSSRKTEGSSSTEERDRDGRPESARRSASSSPTGNRNPSATFSASNSRRGSPSLRRDPSALAVCEPRTEAEERRKLDPEVNDLEKEEKTETENPS